jgi:hypothetical protein
MPPAGEPFTALPGQVHVLGTRDAGKAPGRGPKEAAGSNPFDRRANRALHSYANTSALSSGQKAARLGYHPAAWRFVVGIWATAQGNNK